MRWVKIELINAITKYINNSNASSAEVTLNVKRGGIKKKSQVSALNKAASNTGIMSNMTAISETASKRTKAGILYDMTPWNKKQMPAIHKINPALSKH